MCGIAGIYNLTRAPVDVEVLRDMTDLQRHRGPNDQGIRLFSLRSERPISMEIRNGQEAPFHRLEGGVGVNRLSILDLSAKGHQPMCNRDQTVFIGFNGEMYNARAYRAHLEACGYSFRSRSDTEVVLYLYERYGFEGMLERLNGMFAICLVDLRKSEIYLARDRLGIKPLYWYERNGTFLFASEVKSFLAHPVFQAELDLEHLDEYLMFRYCVGEGFLLSGVRQLEPGHWIQLSPFGWKVRCYWAIPELAAPVSASFDRAVNQLEERLAQSVRMQLASDVAVGAQLSGGVDSSLITRLGAQAGGPVGNAFSIIFDDPKFSEEHWIDYVASITKVKSHKSVLDHDYFFDHLETATWHLDQPLNHPNSVGIFYLAQQAREFVTVLLSGEGADELLGGYTRFLYALLRPWLHPWSPLLYRVPYLGAKLKNKFGGARDMDPIEWFIAQSRFNDAERVFALRPESCLDEAISKRRSIFEEGRGEYLSNCFRYELRTYLVDLLVRQDKMSMAHSIENRVPFLDHKLVEFVRNLPQSFLVRLSLDGRPIRMHSTKIILKKLALKYFEPKHVYRAKSGFGLPLLGYFTHRRFVPIMEELFLPAIRRRGVIRGDVVEKWWRNIDRSGEKATAMCESIWIAVAFEIWAQQYLDRKGFFQAPGTRRPHAYATR